MEEKNVFLSSQQAFSDETKCEEVTTCRDRPVKRTRIKAEDIDIPSKLTTFKRPKSKAAHREYHHHNKNIPYFHSTASSRASSRASSYRANLNNNLCLPEPTPLTIRDSDSLDSQAFSDRQDHAVRAASDPHCIRSSSSVQVNHKTIPCKTQEIYDIPSPPVFSSDEEELSPIIKLENFPSRNQPHGVSNEDMFEKNEEAAESRFVTPKGKQKQTQCIEDTGAPPTNSRTSSFFSFSGLPPSQGNYSRYKERTDDKETAERYENVEIESSKRYYLRAFDYVVREVLARHEHVLSGNDCKIVTLIKSGISFDAKALFVRIYRRTQPHWYRVKGLEESYHTEFDVSAAVEELCGTNIVTSSEYVIQSSETALFALARDLLPTLSLDDVKKSCDCLVDSNRLKRLPKNKLIPALREILSSSFKGKKLARRVQQKTLTGFTPSQLLARAVLKKAGPSIRIPDHVLTSLEKVHFLFFLEEGHDSPNLILADTGRAKFPDYQCRHVSKIFTSSKAFDDYQRALTLEQELDKKLIEKSYHEAVNLGSIAELEVREFFGERGNMNSHSKKNGRDSFENQSLWASLLGRGGSLTPNVEKQKERVCTINQLKHPFFRRYTAQWVYVRACYHSVHAYECLREYESAVELLKLLLSTFLVPKRRGKCLNRITINLYRHLDRSQDALDIILKSLDPTKERLHLGDRLALARRGAAIHKKLAMSAGKRKLGVVLVGEDQSNAGIEQGVAPELSPEVSELIAVVLNESKAKVRVRKIFGKSLNVQAKELEAQKTRESSILKEKWYHNIFDYNRDSQQSTTSRNFSLHGRAVFSSFRKDSASVSVEEYCMEWYFAREGWCGIHDEGKSIRFLFSLFMWESALFTFVPDVFQTPFQDRPLDLFTEAFYESRSEAIENRLHEISAMSESEVWTEVESRFDNYKGTRAIGCDWNSYTAANLAAIAAGLGGSALAHCFRLLSQDYNYWAGGLPDLTLWKENLKSSFVTKFVEVKSARDALSERQKAWLVEMQKAGALCEVCKVVERITSANARELEDSKLDAVCIDALNNSNAEVKKRSS